MAIVKIANRSGAKLGTLIQYVLKDSTKVKEVDGYGITLDPDDPCALDIICQMKDTKRFFEKEDGRELYHLIISFSPYEQISYEKANKLAVELYEKDPLLIKHESLFVTQEHVPGAPIHTHVIINSVSFEDGSKLHTSKEWLQNLKDTNDDLLIDNGLTVTEKGKDFFGNDIERNEPWDRDAYFIKHELSGLSWKDKIACSIDAACVANSKEEFLQFLSEDNIHVIWDESRKHLTFFDIDGHKIRDTKLEKDYGLECSKKSLLEKFEENLNLELSIDTDTFDMDSYEEDNDDFSNDILQEDWEDNDDDYYDDFGID